MKGDDTQELLSERQVSERYNLSRPLLRKLRCEGQRQGHCPSPPYIKLGRMVRYRVAHIEAWLQENTVESQ